MRLYRRGRGKRWWLDVRYRGKRHVISTRTTNQKRANEIARAYLAQLESGAWQLPKAPIHFERLCELARTHYCVNGLRSLRNLNVAIKRLSKEFSGLEAADITTERIERHKALRIEQGAAKSSINTELSALSL